MLDAGTANVQSDFASASCRCVCILSTEVGSLQTDRLQFGVFDTRAWGAVRSGHMYDDSKLPSVNS